jgi:hypothetical protein
MMIIIILLSFGFCVRFPVVDDLRKRKFPAVDRQMMDRVQQQQTTTRSRRKLRARRLTLSIRLHT